MSGLRSGQWVTRDPAAHRCLRAAARLNRPRGFGAAARLDSSQGVGTAERHIRPRPLRPGTWLVPLGSLRPRAWLVPPRGLGPTARLIHPRPLHTPAQVVGSGSGGDVAPWSLPALGLRMHRLTTARRLGQWTALRATLEPARAGAELEHIVIGERRGGCGIAVTTCIRGHEEESSLSWCIQAIRPVRHLSAPSPARTTDLRSGPRSGGPPAPNTCIRSRYRAEGFG